MNASELLAQNGIMLDSMQPGEHKRTCPHCSHKRTKPHQKLEVLSVKIEPDGRVYWCCHHCGWTGPAKGSASGNGSQGQTFAATYNYPNADGELQFQKVRNPPGHKQRFWCRRPNGSGWIKGLIKDAPRPLYRWPEVLEALAQDREIAIVEGEKDADNLWRIGIPATTNFDGAADVGKKPKWKPEYSEQLRGARLIVFNDNDAPGYAHADAVCRMSQGIAARVRRLDLAQHWPQIGRGGDITNWLEAGHTREQLDALIEQAPEYQQQDKQIDDSDLELEEGKYMQGKSTLASNAGNALLALETEPEFAGAFGYDEMQRTEMLLRPLFTPDADFKPRPLTDGDVTAVQAHLQWFGFRRLGKDTTHDAINKHAREHAFHPLRDYLDRLSWDGTGRLRTWLHDYFGAPQSEYTEQIGTMFLISMVARIYRPGCKVDTMLILEGDQGMLKSTACSILAGAAYFSDQLPDITSKEAFQHLRGKWLIEVAELRAYSRAAIDHFKEFLVRDTERYRPPWGRKEVNEPRQCCFVGTTNKHLYLKDETGNRRFWPVPTDMINIERLRADRDQLFAEAVNLFRGGVHWWADAEFERQCIATEQEARFEPDAWEPMIARYLDQLSEKKTTVLRVALGALEYEGQRPLIPKSKDEPQPVRGTPINRLTPADQRRITAVLTHLEWEPKRKNSERWWQPKELRSARNDASDTGLDHVSGDSGDTG
jgi:hypothetical protein